MNAAQITHDRTADHDVMKVGDDKVGIVHMDVDAEGGEKHTGQAADGKETDEAQGVDHGRVVRDRSFVERGGPIENLDRRRDRHEKTQQ
jgi:hypothetical protein